MPDPRRRRGRRSPWSWLLTLIGAGLASGERNVRAIGQGVAAQADDLAVALAPPHGRRPSTATVRRARRLVAVAAREDGLARSAVGERAESAPAAWQGVALDGKVVRGANRHGAAVPLVSLVRPADGVVLGQIAVAAKSNEIAAAPRLLAGRPLTGVGITLAALLAQRDLAGQLRQHGGH